MFLLDIAVGYAFDFLISHAKGGKTGLSYYIDKKADEDILIFGSSRAQHHYDPFYIEDSLGLKCLNCGLDGNGIVAAYARYLQILERNNPKVVIYDVQPSYDYLSGDNVKFLDALKPFCREKQIKSIFERFEVKQEMVKMKSNMYCFNSRIIDYLLDFAFLRDINKGYSPYKGSLNVEKIEESETTEDYVCDVDEIRLNLMEDFIEESKKRDVKLFFFVSPTLSNTADSINYQPVMNLCEKHNVQFMDFRTLVSEPACFQDYSHMNVNGVAQYMPLVVETIRKGMN